MVHICWPFPDATCLEGGCIHCWDAPPRTRAEVMRYASQAGQVPNRGNGKTKDAWTAWTWGLSHGR